MHWNDVGFLISKNRYNENSVIAEFFTKNHFIVLGINDDKITDGEQEYYNSLSIIVVSLNVTIL